MNPAPRSQGQNINQLLNRTHPPGYRSEWTRRVALNPGDAVVREHTVLIFRIGGEWLGLPATNIREITVPGALHSLPHQRNALLGLASVRGELVICIDLARFLELGASEDTLNGDISNRSEAKGFLIVVTTEQGALAFPVSAVHGFHRYQDDELRSPPVTLTEAAGTYVHAILPWRDHAVGCMNDQALFQTINQSLS